MVTPPATGFTGLAEALHAEARTRAGLEDFGPASGYMPGLQRLLDAIDADAVPFGEHGAARTFDMIAATLVSRLYAEAGWRARPDCLDRAIRRPLVITGIPRTGTTALHRLLMLDPAFQGLPRWLSLYPMPRPPQGTWADHAEFRAVAESLRAERGIVPGIGAIHPMAAAEVDECIHLLKQDFSGNFWGASLPVPSYDRWWLDQDEAPSYARAARLLRLIAADTPDMPWLLKNPGHVAQLDALLGTMPDAVVIWTHRDPFQAIGSLASLMAGLQRRQLGEAVDPVAIGRRELGVWSRAVARAMASRDRLERAGAPARFIDVRHADFHIDPIAVVRRIYAALDRAPTAATEAAMRARIAADPERGGGAHRYDPAAFGLDRDEVDAAFADYRRRFGV